jgi:hypothetical protein
LIWLHINHTFAAPVRAVAEGRIDVTPHPSWLRGLHNQGMQSDDEQTPAPPAVTAEPVETTPVVTDILAPVQTAPPSLAEPEVLVEGLRYLQQRIPEFTQLSVQEKRSHARAANLDPEFIENGLHAAGVFRDTKLLVGRNSEELREEHEEIRRWDAVILEMRALTDGIEAANLKRKHRLGTAILKVYRFIRIYLRYPRPEDAYLRPYYENMRRAYLKTQRFRGRKKKMEEPE